MIPLRSTVAVLGVLALCGCGSSSHQVADPPVPTGYSDPASTAATHSGSSSSSGSSGPATSTTPANSTAAQSGPFLSTTSSPTGTAISSSIAGVATSRPFTPPRSSGSRGTPAPRPTSSGRVGPPVNPNCPASVPAQTGGRWQQSIYFPAPGSHSYPDSHVVLRACASSGLPISYALASNTNCLLTGADLDVVSAPADCTVVATQAGNASWAPAGAVSRGFHVSNQYVDGSWGGAAPSVPISRQAGSFVVQVILSSTSSFQVGDVAVASDNEAVCQSADAGTVTANGSATLSLTITLGGPTGSCTLTMQVTGSALSVVNRVQPPRTYRVVR